MITIDAFAAFWFAGAAVIIAITAHFVMTDTGRLDMLKHRKSEDTRLAMAKISTEERVVISEVRDLMLVAMHKARFSEPSVDAVTVHSMLGDRKR